MTVIICEYINEIINEAGLQTDAVHQPRSAREVAYIIHKT